MKTFTIAKVALALAIAMAVAGCGTPPLVTPVDASESGKFGVGGNIKLVEFRGHSYIVFSEAGSRSKGTAAVHDPDCPCRKGDSQ